MKKLFVVMLVSLFPFVASAIDTIGSVYSSGTTVCSSSAVETTGTNRITVTNSGYYEIFAYTAADDYAGVAVKCLQGDATVTVDSVNGWKVAAGASKIRYFGGGSKSISCQTPTGSGFYDVCFQDWQ